MKRKLTSDLTVHHIRNANASRLGETLQSRGDIDAIAVDLSIFYHHITEVDTYTEMHLAVLRQLRVLTPKRDLNRNGGSDCLRHTGKLGQNAFAGGVDESSVAVQSAHQ